MKPFYNSLIVAATCLLIVGVVFYFGFWLVDFIADNVSAENEDIVYQFGCPPNHRAHDEPNEPEVFVNEEYSSFFFDPNATIARSNYYCSKCDTDLGRLAEYATYHICGEKEIPLLERVLLSVPTWPDYIELEKELIIYYEAPKSKDPDAVAFEQNIIWS